MIFGLRGTLIVLFCSVILQLFLSAYRISYVHVFQLSLSAYRVLYVHVYPFVLQSNVVRSDTRRWLEMVLVQLPNGDVQPVKTAAIVNAAGAWAGQVSLHILYT